MPMPTPDTAAPIYLRIIPEEIVRPHAPPQQIPLNFRDYLDVMNSIEGAPKITVDIDERMNQYLDD